MNFPGSTCDLSYSTKVAFPRFSISELKITTIAFHPHGIFLTLEEDREDFWLYLGGILGWGKFCNIRRMHGEYCDNGFFGHTFLLSELASTVAGIQPPLSGARLRPRFPQEYFSAPIEVYSYNLLDLCSHAQSAQEKRKSQGASQLFVAVRQWFRRLWKPGN